MGYTGGTYETPWQTPNTRKAAAFGRPLVETGPDLSVGGPRTKFFLKLRGALAPDLPEKRPQGTKIDSEYGTPLSFVAEAEERLGTRFGERSSESRLFKRSLDFEAHRAGDPKALSGALLYRQPLESDERFGLELSGADQKSQGKTRRIDPLLETSRLASYKKRPLCLEPAWPSWMKADSRLFPTSRELGRSKEEPRFSLLPADGQRYRPSPLLLSPQGENGLDSTRASMSTETSGPDKSNNSSCIFVDASKAPSFSSGTEALFTGQSLSIDSLKNTLESIPFTSRDTRLSLTPMNLFGQISSEDWQTVSPRTLSISDGSLIGRSEDFGIPSGSYGRASMHRTYHGHNVYPLFNENSVTPHHHFNFMNQFIFQGRNHIALDLHPVHHQ
jgi:hypothetical protein